MKEKKHATPVYTFETVDPRSVRSFSSANPPCSNKLQNGTTSLFFYKEKEDLSFSFATQKLFPNIRLLEPIETLSLSPFLLSKIKGVGLELIQDLISFIKKARAQKSYISTRETIPPSSIEEIELKIMKETYNGAHTTPWIEWDRINTLFLISRSDTELSSKPSSIQQSKQIKISQTTGKRIRQLLYTMMSSIFEQSIRPWISNKGGVIDMDEFVALLHRFSHPSIIFQNQVQIAIQSIAIQMGENPLFSSRLCSFMLDNQKTLFCLDQNYLEQTERISREILKYTPIYSINTGSFSSFVQFIEKEMLLQWKRVDSVLLRRIVLWHGILR